MVRFAGFGRALLVGLVLCAGWAGAARAGVYKYTLSGVSTPDNNGHAFFAGSFVFDTSAVELLSVDVTATNPLDLTDPVSGHYASVGGVVTDSFTGGGFMREVLLFDNLDTARRLFFGFSQQLGAGTYNVDTISESGQLFRTATGTVSAEEVPEPAGVALLGTMLGLLGLARRRVARG